MNKRTGILAAAAALWLCGTTPAMGQMAVEINPTSKVVRDIGKIEKSTDDMDDTLDDMDGTLEDIKGVLDSIDKDTTSLIDGVATVATMGERQVASLATLARGIVETEKVATKTQVNAMDRAAQAIVQAIGQQSAYQGRADTSSVDIAHAQSACERGQAARVMSSLALMAVKRDGNGEPGSAGVTTTQTASQEIAVALLQGVTLRQAPGSPAHERALRFEAPPEMLLGGHYAESAVFLEEDVANLQTMSWLIAPKEPIAGVVEQMEDGMRYGLPRQVLAQWYSGLLPVAKGYEVTNKMTGRFASEALPVAWSTDDDGNKTQTIPSHGLLRATALSPWFDASPVNPNISYAGWLFDLNEAGLMRENTRLNVINNRLLYELLVWLRYSTLMQAEEALRS